MALALAVLVATMTVLPTARRAAGAAPAPGTAPTSATTDGPADFTLAPADAHRHNAPFTAPPRFGQPAVVRASSEPALLPAQLRGARGAARASASSSALERLLAPGRFAYYSMVRRVAARHSVELRLVMAIIASESGGDPHAVSPQGAVGLMQLMPETAERLGVDPWDPEQNVEGAIRYLASHLSAFRSVDLSLVAYNAGPGFAARYRAGQVELGAETRAFLIRVGNLLQ